MTAAFAGELLDAATPFDIRENPFVVRIRSGEVDRNMLRAYTAGITFLAADCPLVISSILAVCDDVGVRQELLGNLLEEEGVVEFAPFEGVTIDSRRRHSELARRFALASGASERELGAALAERPRWFADALSSGDWIGPLAYFAVGIEANVPATFRLLIPPLRDRYGFSDSDIEFLTEHVVADERHGVEGAAMVANAASARGACDRALTGARRGGMAWWQFHRRFAQVGGV